MSTNCTTNLSKYPDHATTANLISSALKQIQANTGEKSQILRRIKGGIEFLKNADNPDPIYMYSQWHQGHPYQTCRRTIIKMLLSTSFGPSEEMEKIISNFIKDVLGKMETLYQKVIQDKHEEIVQVDLRQLHTFFDITQKLEAQRFPNNFHYFE